MSASHRKDRVAAIGICNAPLNLSKEAFETKITSLVDSLVAVPIAQKNYLKFELIFQNASLNPHLKALGLPEAPLTVWVVAECEIFADKTFVKLLTDAEDLRANSNTFFLDVVTRVDQPAATNRARMMWAIPRPIQLSSSDFGQKSETLTDRFVDLPIVKKNLVKHSVWLQNNILEDQLQAMGFPAPEPVFIAAIETESLDRMIEWLTHPEYKEHVSEAVSALDAHTGISVFGADAVTKIQK